MHVDAQRLSTHLLGVDTCGEGKPVVSMNDVELLRTSHHSCNDRIVIDFVVKVGRISTSKAHTAEVIDIHIIEVGIDMITITEIVIRVHDVAHTLLHIVIVDIAPGYRHTVHGYNFSGTAVFITKRMRQTESDIHIALSMQSL